MPGNRKQRERIAAALTTGAYAPLEYVSPELVDAILVAGDCHEVAGLFSHDLTASAIARVLPHVCKAAGIAYEA